MSRRPAMRPGGSSTRHMVRWNPHLPGHYCHVGGGPLQLCEVREGIGRVVRVITDVPQVRCLDWSPDTTGDPLLLAAGVSSGKVVVASFAADDSSTKELVPLYNRPCNAVMWNPDSSGRLAAGLDKIRNDCGLLVWDLQGPSGNVGSQVAGSTARKVTKPLIELANSEATVSLSWLPSQPSALAAGTNFKWLRIYDLRMEGGKRQAPLSVVAHPRSVLGCKIDPFKEERVATFSEEGVVKIWDVRKIEAPVISVQVSSTRELVELEWSLVRPGFLATISREESFVTLWDMRSSLSFATDAKHAMWKQDDGNDEEKEDVKVALAQGESGHAVGPSTEIGGSRANFGEEERGSATSSTERITRPHRRRYAASGTLADIALQPPRCTMSQETETPGQPTEERMLVVTWGGRVENLSLQDSLPLAISPLAELSFSKKGRNFHRPVQDSSAELRARALAGYSVDAVSNRRLFCGGDFPTEQISHLWEWIDRASRLASSGARSSGGTSSSPLRTSDAGAVTVLAIGDGGGLTGSGDARKEMKRGFRVYRDRRRSIALQLCGWSDDGMHIDAKDELEACESRGDFGRAAALAVFSLDLDRAAAALRRGAAKRGTSEGGDMLQLVAMALAGYPMESGARGGSSAIRRRETWCEMCTELRAKLSSKDALLGAACAFLVEALQGTGVATLAGAGSAAVAVGAAPLEGALSAEKQADSQVKEAKHEEQESRPDSPAQVFNKSSGDEGISMSYSYACVMENSRLSLADRTAFACRFLPDAELHLFCRQECARAVQAGQLEGVVLTGLGRQGLLLLQSYVDRTGDAQTAALASCFLDRTLLPAAELERVRRWVTGYRGLLNQWRLWSTRARLDVTLAEQARSFGAAAREAAAAGTQAAAPGEKGTSSEFPAEQPKLSAPPQLYVRCNYCNRSLHMASLLERTTTSAPFRERSSRRSLPSCPSCRKPLPRCGVCLLPMNCTNPYSQLVGRQAHYSGAHHGVLTSRRHGPRGFGDEPSTKKTTTEGAAFNRWFSWCLKCRHGGHAECMMRWFDGHHVCPVSDCDCHCMAMKSSVI